jgi:branched-chain amino acid transport system ATP-binding protein
MAAAMLLEIENLVTGYGRKQVLNGVSLTVGEAEIVAVIGHNGAGKSTLLKAILQAVPVWSGRISFNGRPLTATPRHDLVRSGIVYVAQGHRVFGTLTVRENLEIAGTTADRASWKSRVDAVLDLFPSLSSKLRRRASTLSGGEMQMLALANALIPEPRLLLMDEPSLGLAPPLVSTTLDFVQKICRQSRISALIVEQKVREVLKIADSVCVLRSGEVSYFGPATVLDDRERLRDAFL